MTKHTIVADLGIFALWLGGLIPLEWAALFAGLVGCVLGGVALYRANQALRFVTRYPDKGEIERLQSSVQEVQSKLKDCD